MHVSSLRSESANALNDERIKNAVDLGRANALDCVILGGSLTETAVTFINSIEASNSDVRCAVMLVNDDGITLSPLVAPHLPASFIQHLEYLPIAENSGCCGSAVLSDAPVYINDVSAHPSWSSLCGLAESANIVGCWSHPLHSANGHIYGTLALFFNKPHKLSEEGQKALAYKAKVLSLIMDRFHQIEALKTQNQHLQRSLAEKEDALIDYAGMLETAVEQRNDVRMQLLEMENMASLGTMMSSLTHEINTPIGIAITAASYLKAMQQESFRKFSNDQLKRSDLASFYDECNEVSNIIEYNLNRTSQVISTFKQLSTDQHSEQTRTLNLCHYIDEVLLSLKPTLKKHQHIFCIDVNPALECQSLPGAISQILINLIINSINHAFEHSDKGHITISAKLYKENSQRFLALEYADNGKGMSEAVVSNIYKPFFTCARESGGTGLGMHICYKLAVEVLQGSIECTSKEGKGTRFVLHFPVN